MDKRLLIVVALVVVAIAALLVRGVGGADEPPAAAGPMDKAAVQACKDFKAGYPGAKSQGARLRLSDKVMRSTMDTDNDALADRAAELGRSADDGDKVWKQHADAFSAACQGR